MRTFGQYENDIIKCIKKHEIYTIEMVFTFYSGISRSQFYKIGLNKSDTLKDALDDSKNRTKHSMLADWRISKNATLQIGLMKLIGTDEEYHRLANTKIDITTREERPIFHGIDLDVTENEQAEQAEQD